ncbi:CD48 antigen-like [Brachyhypopomus gauderio]|uniref:CD48 antigen-like n=1 Tax=Brachyhypopomus gauderio TaxID=698409 RepID=UPI004041E4D1
MCWVYVNTNMLQQWIFVLSVLGSAEVSSEVFRPVGSSIQLDVQQHGYNYEDFTWMFNDFKIVKYYNNSKQLNTYHPFKGRVEFNSVTHSLTLMNLQKNDSGLYTARASGEKDKTVAEYTLSVWDPVETPVLSAVTDQQSSDPCNITLTCRGHDLSVNSSCYNETCEEKEVTSTGGVTLFLSVRDSSSIICNISNPASWNMSVMNMSNLKLLCHHKVVYLNSHEGDKNKFHSFDDPLEERQATRVWNICSIVGAVAVVIFIILVVLWKQCKTKSTDNPQGVTVYAEVVNGREVPAIVLGNQESNGTTPE